MNLYAFELGRVKNLSIAELESYFGRKPDEQNLDSVIYKIPENSDFQKIQDELGGTIKIVQILRPIPLKHSRKELEEIVESILLDEFSDHQGGKVVFAISKLSYMNPRELDIKHFLNFSKKILKSLKINSRFVNKSFENPKPSTIFKSKAIEKGLDLCIIKGKNEVLIGKTLAIQNINSYSARDFDKPGRDARVGMLPPKLAQILLNLAGPDKKTIYDPFCGSGTILMEALLLGKTALGSDSDPRMIEFSEKNCAWLRQKFTLPTAAQSRSFLRDAREISKADLPEKIDAIVTESYLGPPLSKTPPPHRFEQITAELLNLHSAWLRQLQPLLPAKTPVILCTPAYRDPAKPSQIRHLPNFSQIASQCGFNTINTFNYSRPDQVVGRDIHILQKS